MSKWRNKHSQSIRFDPNGPGSTVEIPPGEVFEAEDFLVGSQINPDHVARDEEEEPAKAPETASVSQPSDPSLHAAPKPLARPGRK